MFKITAMSYKFSLDCFFVAELEGYQLHMCIFMWTHVLTPVSYIGVYNNMYVQIFYCILYLK